MEPLTLGSRTPEEHEERQAAVDRGSPFLLFSDGDSRQRIFDLQAPAATRSRSVAASRPTSRCRGIRRPRACTPSSPICAGEWTICDDGLSQNGTWVNGLRLAGRRRLADGDLVKIGRTIMSFHQPGIEGPGPTMVEAELSSTPRFSEQQQRILRALCRPLFGDGDGFDPASDLEVAEATGIEVDVVIAGARPARAPVRPRGHAAARAPRRGRAARRPLRSGRSRRRRRHSGIDCARLCGRLSR